MTYLDSHISFQVSAIVGRVIDPPIRFHVDVGSDDPTYDLTLRRLTYQTFLVIRLLTGGIDDAIPAPEFTYRSAAAGGLAARRGSEKIVRFRWCENPFSHRRTHPDNLNGRTDIMRPDDRRPGHHGHRGARERPRDTPPRIFYSKRVSDKCFS